MSERIQPTLFPQSDLNPAFVHGRRIFMASCAAALLGCSNSEDSPEASVTEEKEGNNKKTHWRSGTAAKGYYNKLVYMEEETNTNRDNYSDEKWERNELIAAAMGEAGIESVKVWTDEAYDDGLIKIYIIYKSSEDPENHKEEAFLQFVRMVASGFDPRESVPMNWEPEGSEELDTDQRKQALARWRSKIVMEYRETSDEE